MFFVARFPRFLTNEITLCHSKYQLICNRAIPYYKKTFVFEGKRCGLTMTKCVNVYPQLYCVNVKKDPIVSITYWSALKAISKGLAKAK